MYKNIIKKKKIIKFQAIFALPTKAYIFLADKGFAPYPLNRHIMSAMSIDRSHLSCDLS